jgi:predicted AlkP superfamily phosphohydrolase/phosphomutase
MKKLSVVLLIIAFLCSLVLLASCAKRGSEPVGRKMMVIGIDGLEWDIMGPMIKAGRLPHLAKLVDEGSWGELQSLDELESPMIWTSIATGKLPEKHGITGFTTKRGAAVEGAILTSNYRRAKTVWHILGDKGRTVGIVSWLVTWPAEPVNGYLVTDYFSYQWEKTQGGEEAMTFPPELAAELTPLHVSADGISDEQIARFVTGNVAGNEKLAAKLRELKGSIASDETARAVGLSLAKSRPVDFFAVYLRGLDGACHHFWTDMFPDSGPPVDPDEVQAFGETIRKYYEYTDGIVGEFLDLTDAGWTVIVTSDHGHSGPKLRGTSFAVGTAMHDPTGVVVLSGKDIVARRKLSGARVLDLTPTILTLFGLPVATDMDGRPLTGAIDPGFLKKHPVKWVETYEVGEGKGERAERPADSAVQEQVQKQLRSNGYGY